MQPDYHCPVCGVRSELIMCDTQAFCRTEGCKVICFNPSLPDGGLSHPHVHYFGYDKPEPDADA